MKKRIFSFSQKLIIRIFFVILEANRALIEYMVSYFIKGLSSESENKLTRGITFRTRFRKNHAFGSLPKTKNLHLEMDNNSFNLVTLLFLVGWYRNE